jgi:mono/diheme cytochrome c family protein
MQRTHILVLSLCLGLFASASARAEITLPDGPGRDLVYAKCQTCHDLQYVKESQGLGAGAWKDLMVTMYGFGLRIPDSDKAAIVKYLSTYLGPNPPPAPKEVASTEPAVDGAKVFSTNCTACHRDKGQGVKGSFPPLSGNSDLFLDRLFPVHVLLHGMKGKIKVNDGKFNGVMPSFAHLKDGQIAAVINYVRSNWGNDAARPSDLKDLAAEDVAKLRDEKMSSGDVYKLRTSYKKGD